MLMAAERIEDALQVGAVGADGIAAELGHHLAIAP
jgi:hypothetical protein